MESLKSKEDNKQINDKEDKNTRSATASYKGYTHQRIRLMNLIFTEFCKDITTFDKTNNELDKLDKIEVQEENKEDIDITETENDVTKLHLYQLKYLNTDTNESLTYESGLTKVIISHYDNPDIVTINYEVVSTSGKIDKTSSIKLFEKLLNDKVNHNLIGDYLILLYCDPDFPYNKVDVKKIYSDSSNKTDYDEFILYLKDTPDKLNLIDKKFNNNHNDYNNKIKKFVKYCYHDNTVKLIEYLKKIKIKINKNAFNEMHNETLKAIEKKFNKWDHMSNGFKEHKGECIYGLFEQLFVKNLFNENKKLSLKTIIKTIIDKINQACHQTNDEMFDIILHAIQYSINDINNDINYNIKKNYKIHDFLVENILDRQSKKSMTILIKEITKMYNNKKCTLDESKVNNSSKMDILERNSFFIIRNIIKIVSKKIDYDILEDRNLLGFLARTHGTEQKLTRNRCNSLKNIDDNLVKYREKAHNKN